MRGRPVSRKEVVVSTRRLVSLAALLLMSVLLVLVFASTRSSRGDGAPHQFELAGGKKVTGVLLRVQPESFLVQTERECLLVSSEELETIDGRDARSGPAPVAPRVPRRQETFERVLPDGRIELHSLFTVRNTGSSVVTETNWGLRPHEYAYLSGYRVVDEFGNVLPMRVVDEPERGGKRVFVTFARPVLPGEECRITHVVDDSGQIRREGSEWVYRVDGDYPDDRLVTRSVLLPPGAKVLSVTPEPLHQIAAGGAPLVIWRRYFLQGETAPWTIRYSL
jgi:hypothetical protein